MIYIEKNTSNTIVLTLSESTTDRYFIFAFLSDNTNTVIYYTTPDISLHTERYNMFVLDDSNFGSTIGGDDTPLNIIRGQYTYKIYSSSTPIDFNNIEDYILENKVIETGRMVVEGLTDITDPRYQ